MVLINETPRLYIEMYLYNNEKVLGAKNESIALFNQLTAFQDEI